MEIRLKVKLLIILSLIGILFIQGCSEENYEPIVYNRTKLLNCNQNFSDEIPNMVHSTELITEVTQKHLLQKKNTDLSFPRKWESIFSFIFA